jgi:hypothetical protein
MKRMSEANNDFIADVIRSSSLTKREKQMLSLMKDGEEMFVSGMNVWVGEVRTNYKLFLSLLRLCAIRKDCETTNAEYWEINETGLSLLNCG